MILESHPLAQMLGTEMTYALTWFLRDAGLNVAEQSGWKTRGHGNMGAVKGVMCHHTVGPLTGNMPSLNVITNGRPGLSGPLAQIGLGRDGTCYVIAAGRAYHAGSGNWQGYTHGNSNFIGRGGKYRLRQRLKADPWPGSNWTPISVAGHPERSAPTLSCVAATRVQTSSWNQGRSFDMNDFRFKVAAIMVDRHRGYPDPSRTETDGRYCTRVRRPPRQRPSSDPRLTVDGSFNGATEAAAWQFQRSGLRPDNRGTAQLGHLFAARGRRGRALPVE